MHTITLKSDDNFYNTLNDMVKSLDTTKSDLIRKAVFFYHGELEKEKLKKQIQMASYKVRKESVFISNEFDNSIEDGLKDV